MLRRGFTLIELLMVIAIILALVGLLFPAIAMIRDRTRTTVTQQRLIIIGNACEAYHIQTRRFPAEQGVTWTAAIPAWTAAYPVEHRECVSYDLSAAGLGLVDLLERTVNLQPPGEAFAKSPPVSGLQFLVDGWGQPLRYQRVDELAAGALRERATFWTARNPPPALAGLPGQREGFIVYSLGKDNAASTRDPALPRDDTAAAPGRWWLDPARLLYRSAGQ